MGQKSLRKIGYGLILFCETFYLMLCVDSQGMRSALAQPMAEKTGNRILASKPANNNNNNSPVNREPSVNQLRFPNRGIPTGRRRGGTSRNDCPVLDKSLTALVPGQESSQKRSLKYASKKNGLNESKSFLAPTIGAYPTFWVYVPQLTNSAQTGEFILQNEQGQDIYRTLVDLPTKSGILGLKVPTKPHNALKTGQRYHWYFKTYCGGTDDSSGYVYVDAWIKKIALNSATKEQLEANKLNDAQVFINHNLWYEAVNSLAIKRLENMQKKEWHKLLGLLNLSDLNNEKILNPKANFLVK
jgi:hypothetical protein